jgi:hypothetical protein
VTNARGEYGPDGESAIPVLKSKKLSRSIAWYERLGFAVSWLSRSPVGEARMVRGSMWLGLSEWEGAPTGMVELALTDAEDVGKEFGTGFIDDNVFDLVDPDGNRLRIVYA